MYTQNTKLLYCLISPTIFFLFGAIYFICTIAQSEKVTHGSEACQHHSIQLPIITQIIILANTLWYTPNNGIRIPLLSPIWSKPTFNFILSLCGLSLYKKNKIEITLLLLITTVRPKSTLLKSATVCRSNVIVSKGLSDSKLNIIIKLLNFLQMSAAQQVCKANHRFIFVN